MKPVNFADYARYYDILYHEKNYGSEAIHIDGLLRPDGGRTGSLLDVGCGSGKHAREFARLGWAVTGVDLSPDMIAVARAKTNSVQDIEYVAAAAADFSLGRSFTAVVSLFHVLSYQSAPEAARRMLLNVRRHMIRGGRFVFDFWHGPGVLADPPAVRVMRRTAGDIQLTRIAEPTHDTIKHTVNVNYELLVEHVATSRLERICESHLLRYFDLPEIWELLSTTGFSFNRAYAGMTTMELSSHAWYGLVVATAD